MSVTGTLDLEWEIEGAPSVADLSGTLDLEWAINPFRPSIGGFLTQQWALGVDITNMTLVLNSAPTGLEGTLTVEITTLDGSVFVYFPSTMNITEVPEGTGRYVATVPRPDIGRYLVVWRYGDQATGAIPLVVIGDPMMLALQSAPSPSDFGDIVQAAATFLSDDEPFDPDTVLADIINPDGQQNTYTYGTDEQLAQDTPGTYLLNITLDQPGHWYYRIYSTGTGETSARGSVFAADYTPMNTWGPPIHVTAA